MKPIQSGKRVVVIAGTDPASGNADYRKPIEQHTARRIVVIRDGKSVGRKRG
jgi:hypothetical protein